MACTEKYIWWTDWSCNKREPAGKQVHLLKTVDNPKQFSPKPLHDKPLHDLATFCNTLGSLISFHKPLCYGLGMEWNVPVSLLLIMIGRHCRMGYESWEFFPSFNLFKVQTCGNATWLRLIRSCHFWVYCDFFLVDVFIII